MRILFYTTFFQGALLVLLFLMFFLLASWGMNESSDQGERIYIFIAACYICFMIVIDFFSARDVFAQSKAIRNSHNRIKL